MAPFGLKILRKCVSDDPDYHFSMHHKKFDKTSSRKIYIRVEKLTKICVQDFGFPAILEKMNSLLTPLTSLGYFSKFAST